MLAITIFLRLCRQGQIEQQQWSEHWYSVHFWGLIFDTILQSVDERDDGSKHERPEASNDGLEMRLFAEFNFDLDGKTFPYRKEESKEEEWDPFFNTISAPTPPSLRMPEDNQTLQLPCLSLLGVNKLIKSECTQIHRGLSNRTEKNPQVKVERANDRSRIPRSGSPQRRIEGWSHDAPNSTFSTRKTPLFYLMPHHNPLHLFLRSRPQQKMATMFFIVKDLRGSGLYTCHEMNTSNLRSGKDLREEFNKLLR